MKRRRSLVLGIRLASAGLCLVGTGCVSGYGGCLFLAPVKHTLTGRVHFRSYPSADGIDNVPILALDHIQYLYSPAQSLQCLPADELQLDGVSEFPENIVEGSHVSVHGTLFGATSSNQHERFLMHVITLFPVGTPH
jgi:hypothetical protein